MKKEMIHNAVICIEEIGGKRECGRQGRQDR